MWLNYFTSHLQVNRGCGQCLQPYTFIYGNSFLNTSKLRLQKFKEDQALSKVCMGLVVHVTHHLIDHDYDTTSNFAWTLGDLFFIIRYSMFRFSCSYVFFVHHITCSSLWCMVAKNTEMLTRILKWHTKILNSGWRLCSDYIKAIFCIFSTHVKILRLKWPACYSHPAGKLWVEPIFLSHFMQSENKFKWEWFLPLIHTPTSLQPLISHPKNHYTKSGAFVRLVTIPCMIFCP